MFRTSPSSMTFPPCRIRRRNALVSSVYHTSPLFSGLIAALDDGLNRHNPCPCQSCLAIRHNKRTSVQHHDAPPSKRARTRSPSFSTFTSDQSPVTRHCQWCAFSDHPSRQTCRECARRRAPSAMVQRFHVERTELPNSSDSSTTTDIGTDTDTSPLSDADTLSFVREQFMEYPYTPFADYQTDPPIHCGDNYPPPYQSHPLQQFHIYIPASAPAQQVVPHVQSAGLQYASPRSTIPDTSHLTDFESLCSPESLPMESKSIHHVHKQPFPQSHQTYPNEAELDVDKLIEDVSNEILEQSNARMSFGSSALSDVTTETVVALDDPEDSYEHSKTNDDQKALPDENAVDKFLNEMIMSDDEHNSEACNDIADLSLTLLDGMFPSPLEQDVC